MRRILTVLCAIGVIAMSAAAQRGTGIHRVDSNAEKVTVEGTVNTVSLGAGLGTCFLTVKTGDTEEKVILGSFRYLMSNDFSPKAGDPIKVSGFKLADKSIAAKTIELTATKKTIDLRDELGRPLWRGGRQGNGRGANNRGGGRAGGPPARAAQSR
jgi:hypothetical protein